MTSRAGRPRRLAAALGAAAAVVALVGGCGIRPTAVPVDAGAPASRTACPSPVHPPAAPLAPVNTPTPAPFGAARSPGRPVVSPSPSPSAPAGSLFSAQPSPAPSPNGTLSCQ
ncbi:hypothetical protein OG455_24365 [Kitasatospora sp. NBC_01287]|uniref:hypothetical protein n=1 Tax=Kitasatospora sp. NBC_01287 TaxID=2903573 RepID=UPI0022509CB4|nr:hypothetical protein [Kitasatospora sp. NBC_01287]MCX4748614.1 hypothetical protein [Kitasatospora sp. NBC_01287]